MHKHFVRSSLTMRASRVIAGAVTAFAGSSIAAQGISYTLAPAVTSINWDSSLGLKNHSLYGGQASIDFENLIALQGFYFTNDNIGTAVNKLGLTGSVANQLTNQRLNIRSGGANIIWKFWKGGVAPFIKTGGGIIEIRPDSGRLTKQIALNLGGGLRIGANAPAFIDLFAEDMMMRVDRYALFNNGSAVIPADPSANDIRHNFVLGAAIGIPLGHRSSDSLSDQSGDLRWGLAGASLTLEPFAGQMRFDNKALRDQDLVGARAGIDIGRYVGLRGFYWRGTDDNFKRLQSLQSWGGEAQFRLNSSPGLTPYLLAGAAQLDFKQSDSTPLAQRSADKVALLLGGGISLPLGERIAINAAARDYLYGQGNGADSVSSPSDLKSNWMYTVGLRVSVFGRSGSNATDRTLTNESMLRQRVRSDSLRMLAMRRGEMHGGAARSDSLSDFADGLRSTVDSNGVRTVMIDGKRVVLDSAGHVGRGNASQNVITLPVPVQGELYVRYGPPTIMASTRPIMSTTASDSALQRVFIDSTRMANMTASDHDAAMNRRIDSLVAVRVNERLANQPPPAAATPSTTVVVPPATNSTVVSPPEATPAVVAAPGVINQPRYSWIGNNQSGGLMVYSGLTVNDGTQLSIGGRFDLGPISGNSSIHFAPEIAFGGGSGGRSTMIVANAQYLFGKFRVGTNRLLQPHVVAGVGVLNFSDRVGSRNGLQGVINLGYGLSIPLTSAPTNRAAPVLTLEHQGIDLFQLNRLLVGLSWRL